MPACMLRDFPSDVGKTTWRQPTVDVRGSQAPMFGWSELRGTLADWLPPGTLQLGKHFIKLDQHDHHVVVHFADGTSLAARVLVGADGVFSQVRQQSLADGPPDFTVTNLYKSETRLGMIELLALLALIGSADAVAICTDES